MASCASCGGELSTRNTSGLCRRCHCADIGRSNRLPDALCDHCGGAYRSKPGSRYCSRACYLAGDEKPKGAAHHAWKGDAVGYSGARYRTRREIPPGTCSVCGIEGAARHHIDRNILNNDPANIEYLCKSHHSKRHAIEENIRIGQPWRSPAARGPVSSRGSA